MRCAVIFNPTARGGHARGFLSGLRALHPGVALMPTRGPGAASDLAQAAARDGFDLVVAAGGDGTVNEVVNGLARDPAFLDRVRLGILPLGTINVLARELAIPLGFDAACAVIRRGHETRLDLPRVEFHEDGAPRQRVFTQLAGAGLDSRAIAMVRWEIKRRIGFLAYLDAGLRALRGPHPIVRVTLSDSTVVATGPLVVVGNGRRYGGEVGMFPGADLRDGRLDVRVFPRVNLATLLRFGWAWVRRRALDPSDDTCLQAAEFTMDCDQPLPFQVDGDNAGTLPARFTVQREALRVIIPDRAEPGP